MTDTHENAPEDLWVLRGAAPTEPDDDTDDDEPDTDPDEDTDDDPDEDAEDSDVDPDDEDDDDDETDEVKSLKADLATAEARITSLREKVKARGAEITALRAKVAAAKPATGSKPKAKESPDQDANPDDSVARENAELKAALAVQRVRSAFDSETKVQWHDPDVAFGLIDLDDVRDSDGKVDRDALRDALTDLAKERPYLVKTNEPVKPKAKPSRPTGAQPGAHKRDRGPQKAVLTQKYGALRNRI